VTGTRNHVNVVSQPTELVSKRRLLDAGIVMDYPRRASCPDIVEEGLRRREFVLRPDQHHVLSRGRVAGRPVEAETITVRPQSFHGYRLRVAATHSDRRR
jgi:hypothetical protein